MACDDIFSQNIGIWCTLK